MTQKRLFPEMSAPVKRGSTAHNQHLLSELHDEQLTGAMGADGVAASLCDGTYVMCVKSAPGDAQ